jgi:hypothetical protein
MPTTTAPASPTTSQMGPLLAGLAVLDLIVPQQDPLVSVTALDIRGYVNGGIGVHLRGSAADVAGLAERLELSEYAELTVERGVYVSYSGTVAGHRVEVAAILGPPSTSDGRS